MRQSSSTGMDVGDGGPSDGCHVGPYDTTIMNRIMLRFRPIAPKPVADGSGPGSKPKSEKAEPVSKRRGKRKYVRVKKSRKCTNNSTEKEERKLDGSLKKFNDNGSVVTLQLLPESSSSTTNLPDNGSFQKEITFSELDLKVAMETPKMVESWVMVEGMTKMFVDREALGSTDTEKMKNLEKDTCPGLISDALNRVQWVNPAYRRMVNPLEGGGAPAKMVVRLVVRKEEKSEELPNFACTVRVVYTLKNKNSQTIPCDVWKMEFGGFAWRLDTKTVLRLGC
ncbi:uncharacterized protein LOC107761277 [Nicotiana tabacum]|uniref:Uncharacterized protein LOC107761277 n=1 Tax=Nicotiana tabacum TaxID=4097 RepID=A0A1S3X4Y4_TOBAC|nr:PREDICTED: uncharacterized protein LOC107761277 [Nicotiana tabacum]